MKARYFLLLVISAVVFLSGCRNPIEEYEPYSSFDQRMNLAGRQPPPAPDDQMPVVDDEYMSSSSQSYDKYQSYDNDSGYSGRTAMADRRPSASSNSDLEVPFAESRGGGKRPVNVGGM